jgi:Ca2+-binding EF-hand superfamily protein
MPTYLRAVTAIALHLTLMANLKTTCDAFIAMAPPALAVKRPSAAVMRYAHVRDAVAPATTSRSKPTAAAAKTKSSSKRRKHYFHASPEQQQQPSSRSLLDPHEDAETIFSQMDADGNGLVSKRELRNYLVEQSQGAYTPAVIDSIFARLDNNHDGTLSLEEFQHGMQQYAPIHREGPRASRAATPKTNRNKSKHHRNKPKSSSSSRNPAKVVAVKEAGRRQQPKKKQQPSPTNTNSSLSKKELHRLQKQAKAFLKIVDTNRDGSISVAELKDFFLLQRMKDIATHSGLLHAPSSASEHKNHSKDSTLTAALMKHSTFYSESSIQKLFRVLDVNEDGRISSKELEDAFVRYHEVRQALLLQP